MKKSKTPALDIALAAQKDKCDCKVCSKDYMTELAKLQKEAGIRWLG